MKFLGRGWQYTAYDLGNGRVLKKRNSRIVAYWQMLRSYLRNTKDPFPQFAKHYHSADSNIRDSFRKIREMNIDPELIGHPHVLENGLDYEQDYIESVSNYLKRVSLEQGKQTVDSFVEFTEDLIKLRFVDKSFNLGANFGMKPDGSFAIIDIGEIYSHPENIQREIERRPWAQPYVFNNIPGKELQDYFIGAMDARFLSK
jgi:hypothetical protein